MSRVGRVCELAKMEVNRQKERIEKTVSRWWRQGRFNRWAMGKAATLTATTKSLDRATSSRPPSDCKWYPLVASHGSSLAWHSSWTLRHHRTISSRFYQWRKGLCRKNGKWGDSIFSNLALNDDRLLVQMAAFSPWNYLAERALVLSLCLKLPGFRGDDGRTRCRGGSLDHQSMGAEIRARIGQAHSFVLESHEQFVVFSRVFCPTIASFKFF